MKYSFRSLYEALGKEQWREFVYFTANAQHMLGDSDLASRVKDFCKLMNYTKMQSQHNHTEGLQCLPEDSEISDRILSSSSMIVSFHYGAYRTIPLRLISSGISLCVVISKNVLHDYQTYYHKLIREGGSGGKLFLLEAEDPTLFFKLRAMVEKNVSVFVYADGARGTFDVSSDKSVHRVELQNASIKVRSGFLDMAFLLALPIYLVTDTSENPINFQALSLLELYNCNLEMGRKKFVKQTIGDIYKRFFAQLKIEPFIWEGWFYLHRYFLPISNVSKWKSSDRIIPFTRAGCYFMLDKYSYRVIQISEFQFNEMLD